ncbi:MAG: hypothetical protein GKC08_01155, partial [Methanosarcinales archaeon]|nr:hypothetical protein [Methanosarcinales archaeon]
MKRMIIAILIIATMLLVSGCAQNGDSSEEEMDDVIVEDITDVSDNVGEDKDENVLESPAETILG